MTLDNGRGTMLFKADNLEKRAPKRAMASSPISEKKEARARKVCVFSLQKHCQAASGNGCLLVNICALNCSHRNATVDNDVFVFRCAQSSRPGGQPCQLHQQVERFSLTLIDPRFLICFLRSCEQSPSLLQPHLLSLLYK